MSSEALNAQELGGALRWLAAHVRGDAAARTLAALEQAIVGARSNIAGARAILWQEGDHDGTPLIIIAESRMAELAVAREREQRAVDALRELVEAEDEVRRASDALTDEDDNAAMMARLATPTSRLTKAWRIARAVLVDEPAAASEPDPATLSVTQGGIGDTAGFFLPPAAATLAEPEVSSDAE